MECQDASGDVHVDVCAFEDPGILTALRLDRLVDDANVEDLPTSRLVRLTLVPRVEVSVALGRELVPLRLKQPA